MSLLAGVADEVPDDHEVAGEFHLLDDVDLAGETGFVVGDGFAELCRCDSRWATADVATLALAFAADCSK